MILFVKDMVDSNLSSHVRNTIFWWTCWGNIFLVAILFWAAFWCFWISKSLKFFETLNRNFNSSNNQYMFFYLGENFFHIRSTIRFLLWRFTEWNPFNILFLVSVYLRTYIYIFIHLLFKLKQECVKLPCATFLHLWLVHRKHWA